LPQVDIQARTVEEAVNLALEQLGRSRDQVKVEVLATDPGGDEVLVRVIAPDMPGAGSHDEVSPRGGRRQPPMRGERDDRRGPSGPSGPPRGDRGRFGDGGGREGGRGGYGGGDRFGRPGAGRDRDRDRPRLPGVDVDPGIPGEIELDQSLLPSDMAEGEHATPQDAIAPVAAEILQKILLEMRVRGTLSRRSPEEEGEAAFEEDQDTIVLNVSGLNERDQSILIGRRGETLEALQFLLNLILSRQVDLWARVMVDVEGYRLRRKHALINLARRTAEQVESRNQAIPLEAMSPYERRIIHMTLAEHEAVTTESSGVDPERRVIVLPK
jgi:spoIIIJ-associated protein